MKKKKFLANSRKIQNELFDIGSLLATPPGESYEGQPMVEEEQIKKLESWIDALSENLPALKSFTLAGGSLINAQIHICRTITRRLERIMCKLAESETLYPNTLAYINRLSDYFFALSRHVSRIQGAKEYLWETPLKEK